MFKGVFLGSLVAELLRRFPLCSSSFLKCNSFIIFEFIFFVCDNVQIDLCAAAATLCLSELVELFPAKTGLYRSPLKLKLVLTGFTISSTNVFYRVLKQESQARVRLPG